MAYCCHAIKKNSIIFGRKTLQDVKPTYIYTTYKKTNHVWKVEKYKPMWLHEFKLKIYFIFIFFYLSKYTIIKKRVYKK